MVTKEAEANRDPPKAGRGKLQVAADDSAADHLPILLTPFRGKAPQDREYRVVDWRVYRQLFKQDTGGTDLLQLVADNARAATVVAKVQQGQPAPDIQHLALRAARRRAECQALSKAQPELWTVFRRVDAVCRRHANRRRNQGWVSVCVSIDRSRGVPQGSVLQVYHRALC
ncbi:hypothetical protein MTO96_028591 [Rhipicephalus appendiculatus]